MEFSVKTSEILPKLELAAGAVEKKSTIPVLSHLLLEAVAGELRITASDLELSVRTAAPAKVKKEGFATVPAAKLISLLRLLPGSEIRLETLDNYWTQITSDKNTYKLVGMKPDNFPVLPKEPAECVVIPAAIFASLADRVTFAISQEESRYTLNAALLKLGEGKATFVATDGHRLAFAEAAHEGRRILNELIPRKALRFVSSAANKSPEGAVVNLSDQENSLFFSSAEWLVIARKISGKFPNYEAVIPKESSVEVSLSAEELRSALRRVGQMAGAQSHAVRLAVNGAVELSARSPEYGEAKETIEAQAQGTIEIGFNANYLLDFLAHTEAERVTAKFKDSQSAGEFCPAGENYRYIVMPMRF